MKSKYFSTMGKKNSNKNARQKTAKGAKDASTADATRELKVHHSLRLRAREAFGSRGEISLVFNEQKQIITWLSIDVTKNK
jgi:hypothetical protein